jgi:calmodulin
LFLLVDMSLSVEQKAEIDDAFALFDKKKGRLGVHELGAFMRHMGQNLANADLVQMAGAAGMDKNAILDWFSKRFVAEESETDVLKSFEVFDRDGNGLISIVELRHVLTG